MCVEGEIRISKVDAVLPGRAVKEVVGGQLP
jgi:hypothetical protein